MVEMSTFNNWLKLFIYNLSKMEERCGNLLKELYTDFSVFIIYNFAS